MYRVFVTGHILEAIHGVAPGAELVAVLVWEHVSQQEPKTGENDALVSERTDVASWNTPPKYAFSCDTVGSAMKRLLDELSHR